MIVIKTTDQIFKASSQGICVQTLADAPPKEHLLNEKFIPDINNVKLWEQIFYKKNYVGIYAAWSPYVEFYIIVYEPLLSTKHSYETYFGTDEVKELLAKSKKLGIELEEKYMWVDEIDLNNFSHT